MRVFTVALGTSDNTQRRAMPAVAEDTQPKLAGIAEGDSTGALTPTSTEMLRRP